MLDIVISEAGITGSIGGLVYIDFRLFVLIWFAVCIVWGKGLS